MEQLNLIHLTQAPTLSVCFAWFKLLRFSGKCDGSIFGQKLSRPLLTALEGQFPKEGESPWEGYSTLYSALKSRIRTIYQFPKGRFWMMLTTQLQPLQNGGNCLLNVQAIAGPPVRTVKGDSKMTSKVISDFKILNSAGKTSLLEVRRVSYRGHGGGRV